MMDLMPADGRLSFGSVLGRRHSGVAASWGAALAAGPLVALAAEGAPAAAPRLAASISWAQWLFALLLVFGALAVFFLLLRRFGGGVGVAGGQLKVLGGVSLGARERVVVVQAGGKQLVLGVGPGRIETLCVLEGEDRMQAESQQASGGLKQGDGEFARLLGHWLGRKQAAP